MNLEADVAALVAKAEALSSEALSLVTYAWDEAGRAAEAACAGDFVAAQNLNASAREVNNSARLKTAVAKRFLQDARALLRSGRP